MNNETNGSELMIQQMLAVRLKFENLAEYLRLLGEEPAPEDFERAAVLIYPNDPIAAVALIIRLQALKRVLVDTRPDWAKIELQAGKLAWSTLFIVAVELPLYKNEAARWDGEKYLYDNETFWQRVFELLPGQVAG